MKCCLYQKRKNEQVQVKAVVVVVVLSLSVSLQKKHNKHEGREEEERRVTSSVAFPMLFPSFDISKTHPPPPPLTFTHTEIIHWKLWKCTFMIISAKVFSRCSFLAQGYIETDKCLN